MTRTVFVIGRILAALGALLVVATVAVFWITLSSARDCSEPDCDDTAFQLAFDRSAWVLPVAVAVGAAGVALIHDSHRKLQ